MNSNNLLTISVLGTSFSIMTDEDPEYLQQIVSYLETRLKKTRQIVNISDPLKLSILTSVFIIDDLFKERQSGLSANEARKAGDIVDKIFEQIDNTIE